MTTITKAIIPAAGLGTRFLPATKAMPKEMLPIIDKPVVQIIVEQLVEAGVTDIIIVTGPQKRAIEDHFDRAVELEQDLIQRGKHEEAQKIRDIAELANFVYVRQKGEPKGNARPILNAAHLLGDEPFLFIQPDDFFYGGNAGCPKQLVEAFERNGSDSPVLALYEINDMKQMEKYGCTEVVHELSEGTIEVGRIVEKPKQSEAPSNLASVHGYVLVPEIIDYIHKAQPRNGEIYVLDAITEYRKQKRVLGQNVDGVYMDCGSPEGYLRALMYIAARTESVKHIFD